ncbi:uncharacterized protein LOC144421077 [Styela clava]
MNLLRTATRRALLLERLVFVEKHLLNQKNWLAKSIPACNYAEKTYTRKVFRPAIGDNDVVEIEEQEVVDKRKTESEIYLERKKEIHQNKKKVRKLTRVDKMILVFVGKFENMKDVPDQLTFKTLEKKQEADAEVKHLMLGSVFKYGYFFEYASFFMTFSLLGYALYYYNKQKESAETSTSKNADS